MKILHTADVHLREYDDASWRALQQLTDIGKREDIGLLVISGDLFDEGIDAENLFSQGNILAKTRI
jgi:DNA repair exonuclease SbcCD nuclease subunit